MKRWMVATILSVLLIMSGSVLAVSPADKIDWDNVVELPGIGDLKNPINDPQDDADDNSDDGGLITPNGAIWPKGVW